MKKIILAGISCLLTVHAFSQDQNFPAKVGISIGAATPQAKLHIGAPAVDSNLSTIRIGTAGDFGSKTVPLNGVAGAYNIDFHTWRDVTTDQIGARIRAERVNRYQANNALIQGMDLAFHTSPGSLVTDLAERMRITHIGNVGIGNAAPSARLHVSSPGVLLAMFTRSDIPPADAMLYFSSASSNTAYNIPMIRARSYCPTKPHGLVFIGEADDIAAAGADQNAAAIILDGRSKVDTRLTSNNILAINSANTNLLMVKGDGSVGIGATDTKGYKLAVNGNAVFTKVVVKAFANWPDYVFADNYKLRTISELAHYIDEYHRLPGMPAADEVAANGQDVGEVNRKLLEKVEELTLYIIQLSKRLDEQQQELKALKSIK